MIRSRKAPKRAVALLGAAVTAMAVAACASGGGSSAATSAAAASSSGAASSGALTTIKVSMAPIDNEEVYLAQQEGYFKQEGLNVELVQGGTAAQQTAQLASGQVNVTMDGGVSVVAAIAQGINIVAFAGAANGVPTNTPGGGLIVNADSPVHSVKDLVGKTVALQGTHESTQLATMVAAEQAGVNPNSITFVQLPLANITNAVKEGQVAAGYPIGAYYGAALAAGFRAVPGPDSSMPNAPDIVWVASGTWLSSHEQAAEKFTEALNKAITVGSENNFALFRQMDLEHTSQSPSYIKNQLTFVGYGTWMSKSAWEQTADAMYKFGWIKKQVSVSQIVSPIADLHS